MKNTKQTDSNFTQKDDKGKDKNSAEERIKEGQKAIDVHKKISGKSKEEEEKNDKEDAEKWRNEG
jgi:hypothetical protein